MIFFEVKNKKDGKMIVGNMSNFADSARFLTDKNTKIADIMAISRYLEKNHFSVWVISVNDNDLYNSAKRFNLIVNTYTELAESFSEHFLLKMNAHSHTITTIQGQMSTKLEGLISRKHFKSSTYVESIEKIEKLLSGKEKELSEILFYLDKRLSDMKNQIDGFNLLYADGGIMPKTEDYEFVNIKKVLLGIATPFLDNFRDKGVRLDVDNISDDYAQQNKINLHYKFFNLSLYNFFDNVAKYTKTNTDLKITFKNETQNFSILFEMISRHIEEDEFERIFEDSYSGRHSAGQSGNGIGMFYTKKALNMIGLDICVDSVNGAYTFNGDKYSNNIFKIFNLK